MKAWVLCLASSLETPDVNQCIEGAFDALRGKRSGQSIAIETSGASGLLCPLCRDMGEGPFRVLATLLVVTHVAATAFAVSIALATLPSWVMRIAIVAISARMFFVRDMDNSLYQQMVMLSCLFAAAVDLFWAWAWLDVAGDWVSAGPQLAAALVSICGAKAHLPSNLEDRRKFTALLLVAAHGVCFFFGSTFYPGFRWLVYFVGLALSARLFWTKVENVNLPLGTLAIVTCTLLAGADLWIVVWCLTSEDEDDDLPRKWILSIPNAVAAIVSLYTSFTLVQDRKLLADILVTV